MAVRPLIWKMIARYLNYVPCAKAQAFFKSTD